MDWRDHLNTIWDVCWYICRHGKQPFEQVERWPLSKIRRSADSLSRLIEKEYPDDVKRKRGRKR